MRGFPQLRVYVGLETDIPAAVAAGGAGTICGLANLAPRLVRRLLDGDDPAAQDEAESLLARIGDAPFIPLFKAALAVRLGDPAWARCRVPYRSAADDAGAGLARLLAA